MADTLFFLLLPSLCLFVAKIMRDILKAINSYQSTAVTVVRTTRWTEQHFQRCFLFYGIAVLDLPVNKF